MHRPFGPTHHHAAPPDIQVELPQPFEDSTSYVEYGDSPGTLGCHQAGGNQALPAGLLNFIQQTHTSPDNIALTVYGDADVLRGHATGGADSFSTFANTQVLVGDARLMLDASHGGNDQFAPSASRVAIFGDAELMQGQAQGGDDS